MQLMKPFYLLVLLPSLACAAKHMQAGDAAGGALSGTYPNPTLASPSVVLPSSGIAFGSSTNTVTNDVPKLNWDDTNFVMGVGSPDYSSINQVSTFTQLTSSSYFPGNNVCYFNNVYGITDGFNGTFLGSLYYYYNGGGSTCNSFPHQGFGFSDGSNNRIMDFGAFDTITNFYYTVRFTTSSITAGQVLKTDSSKSLISYDLFGTTQAWTASQTLISKTLAQLKTLAPTAVGQLFYCSDCATDAVCSSTGTATYAFSRISARTTACQ